jgi:hypothetical protein
MEKIIHLDNDARIVIMTKNYVLQYRRKSKSQISWREAGYFTTLTSLYLEYLNSAPRRSDNAIHSLEELVQVIQKAESNIYKLINK